MRNGGLRSRDNHCRYNLRYHFHDASYYDRDSRNPGRCTSASRQQSSEQPSNDTKFDGYEVHTSEYTSTPRRSQEVVVHPDPALAGPALTTIQLLS